jgi:hypothetical protein
VQERKTKETIYTSRVREGLKKEQAVKHVVDK